jgi:hypothetical protein
MRLPWARRYPICIFQTFSVHLQPVVSRQKNNRKNNERIMQNSISKFNKVYAKISSKYLEISGIMLEREREREIRTRAI